MYQSWVNYKQRAAVRSANATLTRYDKGLLEALEIEKNEAMQTFFGAAEEAGNWLTHRYAGYGSELWERKANCVTDKRDSSAPVYKGDLETLESDSSGYGTANEDL